MSQLLAGVAKANITPYVGAWMAGFGARDHGAEGVHDDLHARAVVLRAGETTVGLVGCDLVGLSVESVARIRERVETEAAIPAGHVMVGCTHTHSGPQIASTHWPGVDLELMRVTERTIAGALIAASRSMGEASLGVAKGRARIGINRRERQADGSFRLGKNPDGPIDEEVGVLRVNDPQGQPVAVCVTHSCHAVVLGSSNYLLSADYPGQAMGLLERVYPRAVCPYFQGTCGNVNSVPVGGTFEDARRLGTVLGAEALQVAERIGTRSDVSLAVGQAVAEAPLAGLPPVEEVREFIRKREGEVPLERRDTDWRLRRARLILAEHESPKPSESEPLELQGLRLGDALLVTTPGETFVEIGLAIKAASPLPNTFVLGYSNGYMGYFPTAQAFEEGGYEPDCARKSGSAYAYAPGIEAALTEAGTALAQGLGATPLTVERQRNATA